ncbi:hypothetical protein Sango_0417900 [Sesamum angolense]|uniref:Uncharacterized protein n=1 Tax=Sesamum angolense TaxID=2727404 RepID=A0AAE1XAW8_9LAMI|nr:hypothetical protein Sango_0417900 [Sesamum angolense]
MEEGNFSFSAEDLSTIGGIATVSLLHSFIPTHWLPFSIVGRAQKWTLSRTLLVMGGGNGVLGFDYFARSWSGLLGLGGETKLKVMSPKQLLFIRTGHILMILINTKHLVHIVERRLCINLHPLLLVILGGSYVILFLTGKGGHSHSHNQPMEKMAVAGLVLVPALSPCATTLPVFLAVGNSSSMMVLAIIVLLFRMVQSNPCSINIYDITLQHNHCNDLTSCLSFYGASQLKFHWVERYDKLSRRVCGCSFVLWLSSMEFP